jgi:site-specific DNA-methyltransferase (adenine-specific)
MKVIHGDNIELLKQYPDNYFDAIVTDAPYGLGKEPNAEALMKDWIEKGYHEVGGSGFMGKQWDAFVPQPIFWKEIFRVLKYGGHVLAFYGTRTYDWGVMAMRFAGFEVRDCIQWLYGSGFPKSHNISKAIDKMYDAEREIIGEKLNNISIKNNSNSTNTQTYGVYGNDKSLTAPSTDQAKQWEGYGSALKPANEPIVLARKPLEKGLSIAENVLKWGTGAINIDGCRVSTNDEIELGRNSRKEKSNFQASELNNLEAMYNTQGRFPANLIFSCSCENENEHNEDCPIKILDEQSGELKSGDMNGEYYGFGKNGIYGIAGKTNGVSYGDKGGASRFFYIAKASKSERNKGLEGMPLGEPPQTARSRPAEGRNNALGEERANFHPTVKPIKLMQYLVRLVTPPNGIVLDPFCGSGTTGIACKLEGFDFVGLEQDAEYCKIAQARIDNYVEDKKQSKKSIKPKEDTNLKQQTLF